MLALLAACCFWRPGYGTFGFTHRITVSVMGGYMWMKRLVTLSMEWKTSELRQVMMAMARGPKGEPVSNAFASAIEYRER